MFSQDYINDMETNRNRAFVAMHEIGQRAKDGNRLSGEDLAAFEAAEEEYNRLGKELERVKRANEAGRDERPMPAFLTGERSRGAQGVWTDEVVTVPFAEVASRRVVNRDGSAEYRDLLTSDAAGTQVQYAREIWERLIDSSAVLRAGFRTIATEDGSDFVMPRFTAYGTAAITGEGSAIAEDDPTDSSVTFKAHKYAILLQASNEFLADAPANAVEQYLGDAMVSAIDLAVAPDLAQGTGTVEPLGVFGFTAASTVTSGTAAGSNRVDSDAIIEAYYTLESPYRRNGVWIMEDQTLRYLAQQTDSQGRPFITPQGAAGNPVDLLMGRPVFSDTYSPAVGSAVDAVWFGDPNRAGALRVVSPGLQLARSNDFAFSSDLTTWRGTIRLDLQEVDTQASVFIAGATS